MVSSAIRALSMLVTSTPPSVKMSKANWVVPGMVAALVRNRPGPGSAIVTVVEYAHIASVLETIGRLVRPEPSPANTPAALTEASTVPALFCHCCMSAVWAAVALTASCGTVVEVLITCTPVASELMILLVPLLETRHSPAPAGFCTRRLALSCNPPVEVRMAKLGVLSLNRNEPAVKYMVVPAWPTWMMADESSRIRSRVVRSVARPRRARLLPRMMLPAGPTMDRAVPVSFCHSGKCAVWADAACTARPTNEGWSHWMVTPGLALRMTSGLTEPPVYVRIKGEPVRSRVAMAWPIKRVPPQEIMLTRP